jgi:hypothetical protein
VVPDARQAADSGGTVQQRDPSSTSTSGSALSAALGRDLATLAGTLGGLADDLERGAEVRLVDVQLAVRETESAIVGLRFGHVTAPLVA